jgi:hypothetical protein
MQMPVRTRLVFGKTLSIMSRRLTTVVSLLQCYRCFESNIFRELRNRPLVEYQAAWLFAGAGSSVCVVCQTFASAFCVLRLRRSVMVRLLVADKESLGARY